MNINESFPSKYLKAVDLKGRKIKVQIERIEIEKLGDDTKPVIYFLGKDKGLVLNKSNAMIITSVFGPETNDWEGQQIYLYSAKVAFNGQMVDALRVEVVPEVVNEDSEPSF